MVNKILSAVTKQLGTTFGSGYHYYVENVEQNLKTPCFTADVLIPLQRSTSPVLYSRTMPVVVHYFSDSKNDLKNDCYKIAEQTVDSLEYLPFENTILRGEDISWQIVDDVLQIFITYKFTTVKSKESEESMNELIESTVHTQ